MVPFWNARSNARDRNEEYRGEIIEVPSSLVRYVIVVHLVVICLWSILNARHPLTYHENGLHVEIGRSTRI